MTREQGSSTTRARVFHVLLGVGILTLAVVTVSLFPVRHTETPPFASPAFQRVWSSGSASAARGIDLWGSEPLAWRVEAYAGAPNNRRTVQYFDRGRMEVEAGSSDVTLGLLARELITGKIDLGNATALERQPPEIPIDSGPSDGEVPTYLTLSRLASRTASDLSSSNQRIIAWVHRSGPYERSSVPELRRYAEYIEVTGHNLPDVTVELFEQPEFRGDRWIELLGYPISEPYWSYYRRGDEKLASLIQVFERRILVYTPAMDPSQRFTVANSGRHYSLWRYGSEPQAVPSPIPQDAADPDLTLGEGLSAYVYEDDIGTPIDLSLAPSGHLLVLTREGNIFRADSMDPTGNPDGFSVWASGIRDPQGMVTRGNAVLVTAGDRVWWYRERDGVGVREDPNTDLQSPPTPDSVVLGKPVSNSAGQVFARTDTNGSGEVLREIGSNDPVVVLDELVSEPGPLEFAGGDLLLAGTNEDGRSSVFILPSLIAAERSGDPVKIAAFPGGSSVRALAIADEESWEISSFGDVYIAVDDGDEASIFAVSRNRGLDGSEVIELAGGLSRPTAMIFGLDGSLFVADADQQRVIRIVHTGSFGSG